MNYVAGYDVKRLRKSYALITEPSPLQAAVLEWRETLDEPGKLKVDTMVLMLIGAIRERQVRVNFGPAKALELLGAQIAVQQGWKKL